MGSEGGPDGGFCKLQSFILAGVAHVRDDAEGFLDRVLRGIK